MFDLDEMYRELGRMPQRAEKALVAYGKTVAADLQREAQEDRPWTDRTAHARQRMKGYCKVTDTGIRIYLAHGVNYGVQLEFGYEEKYAIIYPTLRKEAPSVIKSCWKMIGGMK